MSANFGELPIETAPLNDLQPGFDSLPQLHSNLAGYLQSSLPLDTLQSHARQMAAMRSDGDASHPTQTFLQDIDAPQQLLTDLDSVEFEIALAVSRHFVRVSSVDAYRNGFLTFIESVEVGPPPNFARALGPDRVEPSDPAPLFATADANDDIPAGPAAEMIVNALTEAQEGMALSFFTDDDPEIIAIDAMSSRASSLVTSITMNAQADSSSSTTSESIYVDTVSSAASFASVLDIGTSQSLPPAGADDTQSTAADIAPDDLVDVGSLNEDDEVFNDRLTEEHSRAQQHVSQLMRELHAPPTRSIAPDELQELPLPQESPAIAMADDVSAEGGMVLLQAAEHSRSSELFLVDEAFAELEDPLDVNVRMESSLGAYQAFDIGSPVAASAQASVRPASSPKPGAARSAGEKSTEQSSPTPGVTTQTATGILATAAAAVTIRFSWWGKRRRRTVNDSP